MKRMAEIDQARKDERQYRVLAWTALFLCAQEKLAAWSHELSSASKNIISDTARHFDKDPFYALSEEEIVELEKTIPSFDSKDNAKTTAILDILSEFETNKGYQLCDTSFLFPQQLKSLIISKLGSVPDKLKVELEAYKKAWQDYLNNVEEISWLTFRLVDILRVMSVDYLAGKKIKEGLTYLQSEDQASLVNKLKEDVKQKILLIKNGVKIKGDEEHGFEIEGFNLGKSSKPELDKLITQEYWDDLQRAQDSACQLMMRVDVNDTALNTREIKQNGHVINNRLSSEVLRAFQLIEDALTDINQPNSLEKTQQAILNASKVFAKVINEDSKLLSCPNTKKRLNNKIERLLALSQNIFDQDQVSENLKSITDIVKEIKEELFFVNAAKNNDDFAKSDDPVRTNNMKLGLNLASQGPIYPLICGNYFGSEFNLKGGLTVGQEQTKIDSFPLSQNSLALNVGNKEQIFRFLLNIKSTGQISIGAKENFQQVEKMPFVGTLVEIQINHETYAVNVKAETLIIPHQKTQPINYIYQINDNVSNKKYPSQLANELNKNPSRQIAYRLRENAKNSIEKLEQIIQLWDAIPVHNDSIESIKEWNRKVDELEGIVKKLKTSSKPSEMVDLLIESKLELARLAAGFVQYKNYLHHNDDFKLLVEALDNRMTIYDSFVGHVLKDQELISNISKHQDSRDFDKKLINALVKISPLAVAKHNANSAKFILKNEDHLAVLSKNKNNLRALYQEYQYDLQVMLALVKAKKLSSKALKKRLNEFLGYRQGHGYTTAPFRNNDEFVPVEVFDALADELNNTIPRAKNLNILIDEEKSKKYFIPCQSQKDLIKLILITEDYSKLTLKLIKHALTNKKYQLEDNARPSIMILINKALSDSDVDNSTDEGRAIIVIREALKKIPSLGAVVFKSIRDNRTLPPAEVARDAARIAAFEKSGEVALNLLNGSGKFRQWFSHGKLIWNANEALQSEDLKKVLLGHSTNSDDDKNVIKQILAPAQRGWFAALFYGKGDYQTRINKDHVEEVFNKGVTITGSLSNSLAEIVNSKEGASVASKMALRKRSYLAQRIFDLKGDNELSETAVQAKWFDMIDKRTAADISFDETLSLSNFSFNRAYQEVTGKNAESLQNKLADKIVHTIKMAVESADKTNELLGKIIQAENWDSIESLFSRQTNLPKRHVLIDEVNGYIKKLAPTAANLENIAKLALKSNDFCEAFVNKLSEAKDLEIEKFKKGRDYKMTFDLIPTIQFTSGDQVELVNKKFGTEIKYKRVGKELLEYLDKNIGKYKEEVADSDLIYLLTKSTQKQKAALFGEVSFINDLGGCMSKIPDLARNMLEIFIFKIENDGLTLYSKKETSSVGLALTQEARTMLLANIKIFDKYFDDEVDTYINENIRVLRELRATDSPKKKPATSYSTDEHEKSNAQPGQEKNASQPGYLTSKMRDAANNNLKASFKNTRQKLMEFSEDNEEDVLSKPQKAEEGIDVNEVEFSK